MKLKHDPYFTILVVLIFAGVVLAFINPTPAAATAGNIPALATSEAAGFPAKS